MLKGKHPRRENSINEQENELPVVKIPASDSVAERTAATMAKEMIKEALVKLLVDMPAFKSLVSQASSQQLATESGGPSTSREDSRAPEAG